MLKIGREHFYIIIRPKIQPKTYYNILHIFKYIDNVIFDHSKLKYDKVKLKFKQEKQNYKTYKIYTKILYNIKLIKNFSNSKAVTK